MKIAIAVQRGLTTETDKTDDWLLKSALEARGIQVDLIDWRDDTTDVNQYDSIIVSSTWNAAHFPDEFLAWIERCEENGKKLINSADVLKLSLNKDQYLSTLMKQFGTLDSAQGSITPSLFIKPGKELFSFTKNLEQLKTENPMWSGNIVIKPIISADGKDTYILTNDQNLLKKNPKTYRSFAQAEECIQSMLAQQGTRGVILQPFIKGVEKSGEYQLVFIDGQFSHATVKPTGFKNNDVSARKVVPREELPAHMLQFAQQIMDYYTQTHPNAITRARLDFFMGDKGPILCEAEMVEPNTNIRRLKVAEQNLVVEKYAHCVMNRTLQLSTQRAITNLFKGNATTYNAITENPQLCQAALKIYTTHQEIMSHLKTAPAKHALAQKQAPIYLKQCFDALNTYAKTAAAKPEDKKILLRSLEQAKNEYAATVLSHDRSNLSKVMRLMLKGIVNFIAGLTLGAAHYRNYQKTGNAVFFPNTTSTNKLEQAHHQISGELRPGPK